jgi:hypothetical protein
VTGIASPVRSAWANERISAAHPMSSDSGGVNVLLSVLSSVRTYSLPSASPKLIGLGIGSPERR